MNAMHKTFRRTAILAKLFHRSLLRRVILGQFLILVVFCVSISANLLWQFTEPYNSEPELELAVTAEAVANMLQMQAGTPENMKQILRSNDNFLNQNAALHIQKKGLPPNAFSLVIRVTDNNGREVYRSIPYPSAFLSVVQPGSRKFNDIGREWHGYTYRAPYSGLLIQVAQTTESYEATILNYIIRYIFDPLLWFVPLATLITYFVTIKGLQPLRQLASLIALRQVNDLRPLANLAPYTETRPLVKEINSLLLRLNTNLQRERNFLADAAHELRTPLAVIQAQVHVLKHADSDVAKATASDELNSGIERIASLVQKLLLTAKVSVDNFKPHFEMLDVAAVVQERVAAFAVCADRKDIDIELTAPRTCHVVADRETFISAVDNVLDNAIRYTLNNGQIRVSISLERSGKMRLCVADNGMGIPRELHDQVFERFFRVPGTEQMGSGLGLAIVKRVLALHGGNVFLSQGIGERGLSVDLFFPLPA